MAYFISPSDNIELQIDVEDFLQQLRTQWLDLKINKYVELGYSLGWEIKIGEYWEPGGLQDDRKTITIEDHPEQAVKFAIWYRSLIPQKYRLFIYHDSDGIEHELLPSTTDQELLEELMM